MKKLIKILKLMAILASFHSNNLFANNQEQAKNQKDYWAKQAECLDWFTPWNQTLEWNPPNVKWFLGGKLNACYNCLDRHMQTPTRDKIAIYWENENHAIASLTYIELYRQVNKFSNVLKSQGIGKGDTVAIYMPMIPETIIAMLSCARIGAVHTVVFGGFSANALKDRIIDSDAKLLITADQGFRRGKIIPLKETADIALADCPNVKTSIVVKYGMQTVNMTEGRDFCYEQLIDSASDYCPCEEVDAEDRLFILYTSGTTGKPKGIIHTTGGYMVGVTCSTKQVFGIKENDKYFCTADAGWITGHSYIVYGPLSNGMSELIYDGSLDQPQRDRIWQLIEKYQISILYTAPTAIRTFMKWGNEWLDKHDLSSLRILGSVGEPLNPEAWLWYHKLVGKAKCPIVDTWWQTETGSIMISPLPGQTAQKPGSVSFPLPGINVEIFDENGHPANVGELAVTLPWPSMLRGIHNDPKRYEQTYWKNGIYFTGDGATRDEDGYYWMAGRIDDVINVSGHRLGTMEIESALTTYKAVAEAAVIGILDDIKGQAIVGFVVLKDGFTKDSDTENLIKQQVVQEIGTIARPDKIIFIADLPKTRSGKIMRRLLRDIAENKVLGDMMTLSDPAVINEIKSHYEEEK
jgi:acetyl-CoA synthetase